MGLCGSEERLLYGNWTVLGTFWRVLLRNGKSDLGINAWILAFYINE